MAISRSLQPRQQYGLGSFVKKIGRGIKKVAKSPLGKAALMYAGTAGLGALAGGAGGTGFGWKMFAPKSIASNFGTLSRFLPGASKNFIGPPQAKKGLLSRAWGGLNKFGLGKAAFLGGGALATALPFMGEDEEKKTQWKCVAMAYHADGTPKRTKGVYYPDINAVWVSDL